MLLSPSTPTSSSSRKLSRKISVWIPNQVFLERLDPPWSVLMNPSIEELLAVEFWKQSSLAHVAGVCQKNLPPPYAFAIVQQSTRTQQRRATHSRGRAKRFAAASFASLQLYPERRDAHRSKIQGEGRPVLRGGSPLSCARPGKQWKGLSLRRSGFCWPSQWALSSRSG